MPFKHVWAIQVGGKKIDEKRPGKCLVQWPDGHEEYITFRPVPYTDVIYEHGSGPGGTTSAGYRPTFATEIHGLKVEVPLENVRVDPATISQEDET
jgi:hypothetical protein